MALGRRFDAVIEPAEAAQSVDAGATTRALDDPISVPPIMLLDRGDLLEPAAARRELGLAPEQPAALVQLGSGNNNDIDRHLDHIAEAASCVIQGGCSPGPAVGECGLRGQHSLERPE